MPILRTLPIAALALGLCAFSARAQTPAPAPLENVVQLSASSAVDVPQDVLTIQLQAVREGTEPAKVQADLKAAVDAALVQARRDVRPGALEVRTGNFSVQPRYGRDQKISAWIGTALVIVEGNDIAGVSESAGRLSGLEVVATGWGLSRAEREKAGQQAQAEAIARFRAKAAEVARGFGFNGYGLREVSIAAEDAAMPRPLMVLRAKANMAAAQAPVPVEAGRATVVVTVSGSVQLR